MPSEDIDPEIHSFISAHVKSVAQLEILLLLHTDPKQSWSTNSIARELRIEPSGALQQLNGLSASGLVEQQGVESFRYAPKSEELAAGTVLLARAYLIRRVTVIGLIFAKPPDKAQAFSDAFLLRKDPKKGPSNG